MLRLFRLVLLAVVMDAMMPWVGGFTVEHLANAASETASSADPCDCCSAENEMAAVRTAHPIDRPAVIRGFVAETTWLPDGYAVPLFRPPIVS